MPVSPMHMGIDPSGVVEEHILYDSSHAHGDYLLRDLAFLGLDFLGFGLLIACKLLYCMDLC